MNQDLNKIIWLSIITQCFAFDSSSFYFSSLVSKDEYLMPGWIPRPSFLEQRCTSSPLYQAWHTSYQIISPTPRTIVYECFPLEFSLLTYFLIRSSNCAFRIDFTFDATASGVKCLRTWSLQKILHLGLQLRHPLWALRAGVCIRNKCYIIGHIGFVLTQPNLSIWNIGLSQVAYYQTKTWSASLTWWLHRDDFIPFYRQWDIPNLVLAYYSYITTVLHISLLTIL